MEVEGKVYEVGAVIADRQARTVGDGVVVEVEDRDVMKRVMPYTSAILLTDSDARAYVEDKQLASDLINYLTAVGTDFSQYGNKHVVEIAIAELRKLQWASGAVAGDVVAEKFLFDVGQELQRARETHPRMHSLHEAYAVILEELDEFKAHVWEKQSKRDPRKVYIELMQLAAMVARCVADCGPDEFRK